MLLAVVITLALMGFLFLLVAARGFRSPPRRFFTEDAASRQSIFASTARKKRDRWWP
jgi:hypothetical protein